MCPRSDPNLQWSADPHLGLSDSRREGESAVWGLEVGLRLGPVPVVPRSSTSGRDRRAEETLPSLGRPRVLAGEGPPAILAQGRSRETLARRGPVTSATPGRCGVGDGSDAAGGAGVEGQGPFQGRRPRLGGRPSGPRDDP